MFPLYSIACLFEHSNKTLSAFPPQIGMTVVQNRIIYEGSKTFWKTRSNIDFCIVHHIDHDCLEIVAYNSSTQVEAQRLYVNFLHILKKLLNQEVFHDDVLKEKELAIRRRTYFDIIGVENKVSDEFIVQYILSRVNIKLNSVLVGKTEIFLQPGFDDVVMFNTNKIEAEIDKPDNLVPHFIKRQLNTSLVYISEL